MFLTSVASAQVFMPRPPPQQPADYGKVILDEYSSAPGPGAVVFDHWLHRSVFTCRLCHVDIGFAMQAKATGIRAQTNREGFHCGACHDGKRSFNGKTIFASCSSAADNTQCARCHSLGKKGVRKVEYKAYTAKLPKANYGVDWESAEEKKLINPVDFLEGISIKKPPMQSRENFTLKAGYSWVNPILFSHEKHSIWNGCELCHPEIFRTARKDTVSYSMYYNIKGRYCGACHGKVAFPLNNCSMCHPRAPTWAE
jgi:c(7)-type cytochrome triheme protein